jgi:ribosomal RNA assembly protein
MSKPSTLLKIPADRIGALIGPEGASKKMIESRLGVELQIDGESGDVTITLTEKALDASVLFRGKEVVTAIGRGFSPEKAFRLINDENAVLDIVDLRLAFGKSDSDIKRVKGRIIGMEGKTRRLIEELTDSSVAVYGHTVSIIGDVDEAHIAREAIEMLVRGSLHATVYRFLHRKRREIKKKKMEIWEKPRTE